MKRILVVEDDPDWQNVVRMRLTPPSYELVFADTAPDGGDALEEGPYDLLIFDNTLGPVRNASVDLIHTARILLDTMPPVIVYSADLPYRIEQEVKELGAVFLKKGEDLTAVVEDLLKPREVPG